MKQRHKHADVIIAWAEGKDVQVWYDLTNEWRDVDDDAVYFIAKYKYRIKPPPKKYRVALFNNGSIYTSTANTQEDVYFFEATPSFVRWLGGWIEYE